jgi:hypothetical protein
VPQQRVRWHVRFRAQRHVRRELAKRGIRRPTPQDQFYLAASDIGIAYLDTLAAAGYDAGRFARSSVRRSTASTTGTSRTWRLSATVSAPSTR